MLNYHVTNNTIVVNYDGKTNVINKGDSRFENVLDCIKEDRLEDIPEIIEIEKAFDGEGLQLIDGLLYLHNEPMPEALSDRILKFKEEKIPFKYLVRFWQRLKKNPSFNSRQMLFKFLEHNGHPITQDGCFIAYRGCTDDFKDRHTGTFDNSIGAICEIPRDQVDDNPNNTCSFGLHVACHDYAYNWGSKTIEVKVDPVDVVCVPTDYDGTKMRVCKFEVIGECADNMRTEQLLEREEDEENWSDFAEKTGLCSECGDTIAEGWSTKCEYCMALAECEREDESDDDYEPDCEWCCDRGCDACMDDAEDELLDKEDDVEIFYRFRRTVKNSSVISALEYRNNNLTITFNSGKKYRYYDVSPVVANHLRVAESKGQFFHSRIEDKYDFQLVV